ncbi:hypothetical protein PCE1_004505 [Barthelona sp. PCE]
MGIPRFLPYLIETFPACIISRREQKLKFDFLLLDCDSFPNRARNCMRTLESTENHMFKMMLGSITEHNILTGTFFLLDGTRSSLNDAKIMSRRFRRNLDRMYCFMHQINNDDYSDSLDLGHLISSTGVYTTSFNAAFNRAINLVLQIILSWGKIGAIANGALGIEHKMEKIITYCRNAKPDSKILITTPDTDAVVLMLGLNVKNTYVSVVQKHRRAIIDIDHLREEMNRAYFNWRNIIIVNSLVTRNYCFAIMDQLQWRDAMKYIGENKLSLMDNDGELDHAALKCVLAEFVVVDTDESTNEVVSIAEEDLAFATQYWKDFCVTVGSFMYGAPETLQQPTIIEKLTPLQRKLVIEQLDMADLTLQQPLFSDIEIEIKNAKQYTLASRLLLFPFNVWQYMLPEHVYLAVVDALEANDLIQVLTSRMPTDEQVAAFIDERNKVLDYNATLERKEDQIRYDYPEYDWFFSDEEDESELINVLDPILKAHDCFGPYIFDASNMKTNTVDNPFLQVFIAADSEKMDLIKHNSETYPSMIQTKHSSFWNRCEEIYYHRYSHSFASADEIF